jgi:hypothetical protein
MDTETTATTEPTGDELIARLASLEQLVETLLHHAPRNARTGDLIAQPGSHAARDAREAVDQQVAAIDQANRDRAAAREAEAKRLNDERAEHVRTAAAAHLAHLPAIEQKHCIDNHLLTAMPGDLAAAREWAASAMPGQAQDGCCAHCCVVGRPFHHHTKHPNTWIPN